MVIDFSLVISETMHFINLVFIQCQLTFIFNCTQTIYVAVIVTVMAYYSDSHNYVYKCRHD